MRKEHDSLGIQSVPQSACYGIHTVRARGNFPAVSSVNDRELVKNFLRVKLACARANQKASRWDDERVPLAIVKACQDLLAHFEEYEDEFAIPAIQGGAGTSTNMNVNEVVANRAI